MTDPANDYVADLAARLALPIERLREALEAEPHLAVVPAALLVQGLKLAVDNLDTVLRVTHARGEGDTP